MSRVGTIAHRIHRLGSILRKRVCVNHYKVTHIHDCLQTVIVRGTR